MKYKFVCFIMIAIVMMVSCLAFCGCSNDGFELVCQVEYTTNGVVKTEDSRYDIHYSAATYITKEEYDASPVKQRITGVSSSGKLPTNHKIPNNAKDKTSYQIDAKVTTTDDLKRYYYAYHTFAQTNQYFMVKEMYTTYYYIYVKVVDSTTIIVRNNKGDTTYTVSSYRITKFN